jgi:hypothetical protein
MSCFETSKFLKNPKVFSKDLLVKAAQKLNWEYKTIHDEVAITKIPNQNVHGEYAMKVKGSQIIYNSYYLKNGEQLVDELKEVFYKLNVEYARNSILSEFEKVGFSLKKDYDFLPNQSEADRFFMVGYSRNQNEKEKRTEIMFTILIDGSVITDTNYLPDDLHKLSDEAMHKLEQNLGHNRNDIDIIQKPVPLKYQNKVEKTVENKIIAKI